MVNTKTCTCKAKEKGQKDIIGINDIGIFEFIFQGLPNPPDLQGMDEDRLRGLQNAIQEQLCQRDKERERNITKRVQEFEKTFDFVNLLGSIYKLAPFINGAAPFSSLKMEQPFINRAAPFSSILSCSVYKWSCSIFKQLCQTYNKWI